MHAAAEVGEKARAAGGDRENADGGRYLSEILIQQVGRGVFRDPDYPVFRPQFPESAHTGLVNPDNLYESTHIRPGADYVLRGTRGTTADVTFQVFAGTPGVNGKLRDVGTLSLDNLVTDADGNFEVFVGPTAHPQNWIETDDEAGLLLVRCHWLRLLPQAGFHMPDGPAGQRRTSHVHAWRCRSRRCL